MRSWLVVFLFFSSVLASCSVDEQLRNDCGFSGITQGQCEAKGCCWNPASSSEYPWCFFPDSRVCGDYRVRDALNPLPGVLELNLEMTGEGCGYYGDDIPQLVVRVEYQTEDILRVKITDRNSKRWEVPEDQLPRKDRVIEAPKNPSYTFGYNSYPFGFYVQRASTGEVLFNTSASSSNPLFRNLVFEDQYLELSTQLSADANIYGLGERRHSFRLKEGQQYTLWTADELTPFLENNYGAHPFYLDHRSGKSHGVFLLNSNGMDVDLEEGFLRYRVIGGVFDFYFFMGPTPSEVVSQYTSVIGRPYLIPYWSLGFHQCRWGYENIQQVKDVVRRYKESNIPLETMWIDIDYMDGYRDWSFDPINYPVEEVNKFINQLHADGQKMILITDPGIKNESGYHYFDYGVELDIFLKKADGDLFIGRVWPGNTVFPDFMNPRNYQYWRDSIADFLKLAPIDGLWVDMNEVANFCTGYCDNEKQTSSPSQKPVKKGKGFDPNNPPYKINNRLEKQPLNFKTTDMDVEHLDGVIEYDAHNLYGHSETIQTRQALEELTGQRAFVLSRSTFPGTGHHGGHWTGDNVADWEHLYYSIPAMLNFNLFGIPYVGADICGFYGDTNEELCARWMQLGAFYPFSRNHNHDGFLPQEPYNWDSVAEVSRISLSIRYSLLSYYYTLFYLAHSEGETVARPVFFEFPSDANLFGNDRQFLIGSALLFSPVLEQGAVSVDAYFPAGRWYDFYTYEPMDFSQGTSVELEAPLEKIPIHIKEGSIFSLQTPAYTTQQTSKSDFSIVAALTKKDLSAKGKLYLDDGISLNPGDSKSSLLTFEAFDGKLTCSGRFNYAATNKISQIVLLGVSSPVSLVTIDGAPVSFEQQGTTLVAKDLALPLSPFVLLWE